MAVKGSDIYIYIYAGRVDGEWCEPYLQQEEDVRASWERLPRASPTVHARFKARSSLAGKIILRGHARVASRWECQLKVSAIQLKMCGIR